MVLNERKSGLIDALEKEWKDALCSRDLNRLRALMHPRFTLIGTRANGPFILTRDQWLDAIEKRKVVDIQSEIKDSIEFESVMIATTEAKWRVSYLGQTVEDCVLLTDVWVYDEERWCVVRRHLSPVPATDCFAEKH